MLWSILGIYRRIVVWSETIVDETEMKREAGLSRKIGYRCTSTDVGGNFRRPHCCKVEHSSQLGHGPSCSSPRIIAFVGRLFEQAVLGSDRI